jgi:hypothetical protein
MYHYDAATALEELQEDANLPNPVHVRDMILRADLTPDQALDMNRQFVAYQKAFGDVQGLGRKLLEELARAPHKR